MPMNDGNGSIHHLLHIGWRLLFRRIKQLSRKSPVPDRPMHRARGRLPPLLKQRLDFVIGLVDGPGPGGLLVALAAEAHGGFGKGRVGGRAVGRGGGHGEGELI
jgi:hypothetical protein